MTYFRKIQPSIWVHPVRARALLGMGALTVDLKTGQMYTTSGEWVGVDSNLPEQGEHTHSAAVQEASW